MENYPQVNGPEYRGAPQPSFDPKAINESLFDDEMRFKEYKWEEEERGTVLYWTSQDGVRKKKFLEEVKRCLGNWPEFKGKTVYVVMKMRGSSWSTTEELEVE